ncbi:MAG: tripartite tricarboxylate transporter substrate binding protein [Betaproteobacteria bacterium]|nr:tripartite tricarboxylate transporter substrate binding protein [Betaproteobacteria bacterium]
MNPKVLPAVLGSLSLLAGGHALAQSTAKYPERPVRMIVPFQPGGASDFVARIIQPKLGQELDQTIVVDNRSGASGHLGIEVAANATPDGYTILLGNVGTTAINPYVFPKFRPKPLDAFTGVTQVVDVPLCLAVHPSLPVKSVKELIEYAKAQPGKLNYAAAGAGTNGTLAFEYWKQRTGTKIVMIAYKGGAGGAALGHVQGEAQVSLLSTPSVFPYVKSGRLRLLAVVARNRLDSAPGTPTMAESGFPDMTVGSWQSVYVPKGAPNTVVSRLFTAVTNTMRDPEVGRRLATASAVAIVSKSPSDYHDFWKKENDRWAKVVKDIGAVTQQ